MKMPAKLLPENVTAIIDSREQTPLDLSPLKMVTGSLPTGDYSCEGFEDLIAIERKSEDDMLACIGRERERFDRMVTRLLAYPIRAIVVESSWARIESGDYRSKVTPSAALGSLLGWQAKGVPILMCDDYERAGRYVSRILFTAVRRRYRESRELMKYVD